MEGGEDAVRELREELLVDADPKGCRLSLVMHRPAEVCGGVEYLDLFFAVDRWEGAPRIGEPDKASELVWAPRGQLPDDVVGDVAEAIHAMETGQALLLHGLAVTDEATR